MILTVLFKKELLYTFLFKMAYVMNTIIRGCLDDESDSYDAHNQVSVILYCSSV